MGVHGDDFPAEGEAEFLNEVDAVVEKYFDVKKVPRIGRPEFGRQVTQGDHLNCTIRWFEKGFSWEGNVSHSKDLMDLRGLDDGSKTVGTPSSKGTGKGIREALDELAEVDTSTFLQQLAFCSTSPRTWCVSSRPPQK